MLLNCKGVVEFTCKIECYCWNCQNELLKLNVSLSVSYVKGAVELPCKIECYC